MKKNRILFLVAVLLATVSMAVSAEGFSLEMGGMFYDFNALSAAQQAPAAATVLTSNYNLSPDPYVNGSYSLKLNDSMKLKMGLMAEDMMGTISPTFVQIGRTEPYAEISGNGLTFRASFPLYFLGFDTNDTKNVEIKYMLDKYYKGIYLGTNFAAGATSFLFTNYESLSYKISFDKMFAMAFAASTEIGISPTWIYDVKPQISFIYGPLQLDLKESIYFADQIATPSFSDANYATRFYTDPKLTFDFGSIGIKGLKAYLAASLYTANVSSAGVNWYGTDSVGPANSSTFAALGSSVTPGVSYSFGSLYIETSFKYSNYDDSNTDNITKKNPTFDPMLKVSYTLSF
jgi:hypothetical protein